MSETYEDRIRAEIARLTEISRPIPTSVLEEALLVELENRADYDDPDCDYELEARYLDEVNTLWRKVVEEGRESVISMIRLEMGYEDSVDIVSRMLIEMQDKV